jgi:hypothetical protein
MNTTSTIDTSVDTELASSEPYKQAVAEMKAIPEKEVMQFNPCLSGCHLQHLAVVCC